MTPDQFQRVKQLYLELGPLTAERRQVEMAERCREDAEVRAALERLFAHRDGDDEGKTRFDLAAEQLQRLVPSPDPQPSLISQSLIGARVGAYDLIEVIGRGGMGVVYLAHDTRLGRRAALKAILSGGTDDPTRIERLRREARTLAQLSHPNIATIFGLEESNGSLLLAMELIDGQTLAQKLGRSSAMSIEQTLRIGEQIAAALEAAHDAGIVHRDLKPGNVMLTADGIAKVLDFGLARTMSSGAPADDTRLISLTREGSFFGTPAYMSPEQTRGEPLDARSDVFSFGAVLFRCLSGKPAFEAGHGAEIDEAIRNHEPDWLKLPKKTPDSVHTLLRRCLAKEPGQRYRHIGDARLDLQAALASREWEKRESRPVRWPMVAAVAAAGVMLALGGVALLRPVAKTAAPSPQRFELTLPENVAQTDLERIQLAVSPDGQSVVVACSTPKAGRGLWIRSQKDPVWRPVGHTEDAHRPFFSNDGQWIAFHRGSSAFKRRLDDGGDSIMLGPSTNWYGGSFTDTGEVVLANAWNAPLTITPPQGGKPAAASELVLAENEVSHVSPLAVPGSRWVLYVVWHGGEDCDLYAAHLDTHARHLVAANASSPKFASTPRGNYLLFERASSICAAGFDVTTATIRGAEAVVTAGVLTDATRFAAYFEPAADGTLVYFPGGVFSEESRLSYVNPDGSTQPVNDDRLAFCEPAFSADGSKLATIIKGKVYRPFVYDLARKTREYIQIGGDVTAAIPTPDGLSLVLTANRDGGYGIDLFSLKTGRFVRRVLKTGPIYQSDVSVSRDGSFITYTQSQSPNAPRDVWIVGLADGAPPARPFVATPTSDTQGAISPNGKWLACVSELTGRREIYAVGIPEGQPMRQLTFTGGECPAWSPDGTSIYYVAPTGLCKVGVSEDGAATGQPVIVYGKPFGQSDSIARSMTVSPDGRPVIVEPSERRPAVTHLNVLTRWYDAIGIDGVP